MNFIPWSEVEQRKALIDGKKDVKKDRSYKEQVKQAVLANLKFIVRNVVLRLEFPLSTPVPIS